MHEARLVFTYDSPALADLVERAVSQEVGEIESDRTTATVGRDGAEVTVAVEAEDLTALRAGCNTWTSLVGVAEDVVDG